MNFRARVALLQGSPLIRLIEGRRPRWDAERRLRVALANNNGGIWWVCLSSRSVADLERRFYEGSVATVLYEVVGGVLGDHKKLKHTGKYHYLFLQLARRDELIDLSLCEVGVEAKQPIAFSSIGHY